MTTIKSTKPMYRGPSSDHRTNRWSVTCPACGHVFDPPTTMKRYQSVACPAGKCGKEVWADFNDQIVILAGDLKAYRAQLEEEG